MRSSVEAFLDYLTEEQKASVHTLEAYRNDLIQLSGRLASHGVRSWEAVTPEHIVGFVDWMQKKAYAASTIARKIAAVRSFFHFMLDRDRLPADPSDGIVSPRVPRRSPQALSAGEVEQLLDSVQDATSAKGLRDWALLEIIYATGMRVSEVIDLEVQDLDLEEMRVRCAVGKQEERDLPLTSRAVEALQAYLQEGRSGLVGRDEPPVLFVNHRGRPLTRQGLWLVVRERAKASGLDQQVTPHTLRHTFAAHLLGEGTPLQEVQERLGHANLATTQVYAAAVAAQG